MDKLTIKQAALALGVSAQTVRRRIAKGEIPAKKEMTAFGEAWLIPASVVNAATNTVEVVSITHPMTPAEISQIIESAVAAQMAAQVEPLRAEINRLREEIASQTKALEAKPREFVPVRQGFFQRLFGRRSQEEKNDQS